MAETFWGVPCLSGDDKRLTTLILERGFHTYLQRTAQVWSTFPTTWRVFLRQRLRWARNTWRSDLRALSQRWVYRYPFLAFTMIDKAVSCFTLLLGPLFMAWSLLRENWTFCGVLLLWWQISRSAKLLPHLRQRPSSFFFVLGYVAVSWAMSIVKITALLTVRRQRWLTREVAVQDGVVMRTSDRTGTPGAVGAGIGEADPPAAGRPDEHPDRDAVTTTARR
jgi:hyaluronan synthase